MIPDKINELIKKLIDSTNNKKAIWGKTSRPNEFKLIFEKGAITTDRWEGDDEWVDFSIYNAFGDKIDTYSAEKVDDHFELLLSLHNSAKRDFYKVDETIDSLFKEMGSYKSIGRREVEKPDEDLPF